MTPEQLVEQLNQALPGKLFSAILYGSAAAGDFMPATSDYNVLLVVDGLGVAELDALSKPVAEWSKAGHRPPLLFTRRQLRASASVFPIELLDMRQSHRMLYGEDVLAEMTIDREHLRLQLERELTEKLLTLREGYLFTKGRPKQVVRLLTSSVTGVLVLFRAALRLFREEAPSGKAESLRLLTEHIPFDPQPLLAAHDLKHGSHKADGVAPAALFSAYLTTIEHVAEAVEHQLHTKHKEPVS
jgi:hypothetical protein